MVRDASSRPGGDGPATHSDQAGFVLARISRRWTSADCARRGAVGGGSSASPRSPELGGASDVSDWHKVWLRGSADALRGTGRVEDTPRS